MLDPSDAITAEAALSLILQKLGLPEEFANQLAARAFEEFKFDDSLPDGSIKDIHLADHFFIGEKLDGKYCISRKLFEPILEKVQPDLEVVRARNAGGKFVLE